MYNYKYNIDNSNKKASAIKNLDTTIKRLLQENAIYNFSDFELEEKNNIKLIIESKSNIDLTTLDKIIDFNEFFFDEDKLNYYNKLSNKCFNDKLTLEFTIKSLNLQKEFLQTKFDLPRVLKITEKISDLTKKLNDLKNQILLKNNEILDIELDNYKKYLELLSSVSNAKLKFKAIDSFSKDFPENVIRYYKKEKLIYYINLFNNVLNNEEITSVLIDNKDIIGDIFENILNEVKNVGADI